MSTTTAIRNVGGLATTACVRIRGAAGGVVGSGFLVGSDLVATCAHVVAEACGADQYSDAVPAATLRIDFPTVAGGPAARSARVHRWVPIAEDGTGDVALLRLDTPVPPGVVMPPLRRVDHLWDHTFHVFGFPEGAWDGVWSTGRIRGGQGTGWFQLQSTPGDQPIEGGFSGAPVWDASTGAVVGMTVAADRDPTVTTAYLIPVAQVLGLDPELLPCPYRGLEPFEEEHAEYFFGRGPEVERLVEAVERCPLVAVAGPSGAGKSSLVKAGLLPELRRDGARIAEVRARPGAPVLTDVVAALLPAEDAQALAAALADPATRPSAAGIVARSRCVLLLDQFEELAAAEPGTARDLLAALAAVATTDGSKVRVVLTLRGTAFDEVLTSDVAGALGAGTVFVGPMDRAQLRAAVVGPAERAPGLAFEDGLVDRILDDAGREPGQLPLVESLLAQLWTRREGGSLTMRGYEAAGGVAGALAKHAERVAGTVCGPVGDDGQLRQLCTRLAGTGHDGRATRRAVRLDELPIQLHGMVAVLAAARLVVVSGGTGGGTVELAHQSLIDHWPRLRQWIEDDRDFLIWRSDLDIAHERWEQGGRDDGALLRGAALETAYSWMSVRAHDVGAEQAEYVRRSRVRQRREVRRWRVVAAVLAVLTLVAGVLTFVAVRTTAQIAAQLATANAEVIARESSARLGRNPMLGAELALAAWRSDPRSPHARSALADAYVALAGTDSIVYTEPDGKPVTAVTAGGELLVTLSAETGVSVTSGVLGAEPALRSVVQGVPHAWPSPDGSRLVVVEEDRVLRLRDAHGNDPGVELTRPGEAPDFVRFSPDGNRFSWISGDSLQIHDIPSGTTTTALRALPAGAVVQLTADPDLAVVRTDRGRTVRSLASGADVRALPEDTFVVGNGAYAVSCVQRDPDDLQGHDELVVRDTVSDAELRRIPTVSSCTSVRYTIDDRYTVEQLTGLESPGELIRIIDLASGAAYQFVTPDLDRTAWEGKESQGITALPTADGGLDVFVAVGPSVLRVPAVREPPELPRYAWETAAVPHGLLVVHATPTDPIQGYTEPTRFTLHDAATGTQLAEVATEISGGWFVDAALWTLGSDDTGWHLNRYALPDFTPTLRLAAPGQADAESAVAGTATDGTTETAIIGADGMLAAFDTRTGARLGDPVTVPDGRKMWVRPGRPGEAIVTAGTVLELWDVPSGRRLASADLTVKYNLGVITRGDTLVAISAEGNLEVRSLPTMEPVGAPIAAPEVQELLGFDTQGRLVTGSGFPSHIVFWDLERRAEAGRMRPVVGRPGPVHGGPFSINGSSGYLPEVLDLRADVWHEHLCGLLPPDLSPTATGLLPAGGDRSSPCP